MDILFSLIFLIILSPIFLLIIFFLILEGNGIFYKQERIGRNFRHFKILKFSTMLKDSLQFGSKTITYRDDPRVTRIGKVLRLTKLNELPQLINVFKGDMSFIGPRPLLPLSFRKYDEDIQIAISKCYPGLSGIGSIVFRDEEDLITIVRNSGHEPLDFYKRFIYPYKGKIELWYVDNISMKVDVMLALITVFSILFPHKNIVHRVFKDLPPIPHVLTPQGIANGLPMSVR